MNIVEFLKNTYFEKHLSMTASVNSGELYSLKKNFMALFYGRGSTASRLKPVPGGSLL